MDFTFVWFLLIIIAAYYLGRRTSTDRDFIRISILKSDIEEEKIRYERLMAQYNELKGN